jgi:class 3 adenylate cyclase
MSAIEWSDLAVSELPTGTVTLLLADVEGSTRLWETQPKEMTAAIAQLDDTLGDLIVPHAWVGPVVQGHAVVCAGGAAAGIAGADPLADRG